MSLEAPGGSPLTFTLARAACLSVNGIKFGLYTTAFDSRPRFFSKVLQEICDANLNLKFSKMRKAGSSYSLETHV